MSWPGRSPCPWAEEALRLLLTGLVMALLRMLLPLLVLQARLVQVHLPETVVLLLVILVLVLVLFLVLVLLAVVGTVLLVRLLPVMLRQELPLLSLLLFLLLVLVMLLHSQQ